MTPLRYLAKINPPTPEFDRLPDDTDVVFVPLEAVWADGLDVSRRLTKEKASTGYTRFLEGDIVIPKITPTFQADRAAIASGIEGGVAAGTTELHVVRVGPGTDRRYVRYLLSSRPFLHGGQAELIGVAGQKRVPDEWLRQLRVPVSRLDAQREIANFLDAETARIDAVMGRKLYLTRLLQARESSGIEAVVQSLRSKSAQVPVKYVLREIDDRLSEREPPELLSVSIHLGVVPRSSVTGDLPRATELSGYKVCARGDLVINRMRAFQGGLGRAPIDGIVSPDYTVLRGNSAVESRFLHYLLRSPWFIGEMTARLRGIGGAEQGNVRTPRVNFGDLGLIEVPLPGVAEQLRWAKELEHTTRRFTSAVSCLERQLSLLQEHRQALITAAVTGEIDIPGVAA